MDYHANNGSFGPYLVMKLWPEQLTVVNSVPGAPPYLSFFGVEVAMQVALLQYQPRFELLMWLTRRIPR